MKQPPIKIIFMIACHVAGDPETYIGKDHWNSPAGFETRKWLQANDLINEDYESTPKGKAWIEFICETPLPICKWMRP